MGVLQRPCRWIALAVVLWSTGAFADQSTPLPVEIQKLEAEGSFADARARLEKLQPPFEKADVDQHLALITKTTDLLAVVDAYVRSGLTKQATDALTAFLPSVSSARDAYLAIAVQRRLATLRLNPADSARLLASEQAADQALARADTLFARGLYKNAKDAYTVVAKQADPIADNTRARANRGVIKASQKEFEDEPFGTVATVSRSVSDGAKTLWQWLLTLAVLIPVAALLWVARRVWLANTRTLELTDLTLSIPSASANRELAQALEDVIDRIRLAGPAAAKLDAAGAGESIGDDSSELPPPDLVFVTPPLDAPELASELDKFVSSTPTIQVGPIGFNPQQLWEFLKRFVRRRARHAFTGTLTSYDNILILRLTREDRRLGTKTEWRATALAAASEARITCLVDVACRIILDRPNTATVTKDCDSLKAYILGLYALETTTPDALRSATAHFQEALDRDEDNWLARFQLALCARGQKDTRTAIRHLTWFEGSQAAANVSFQRHLKRHPDFPYVVRYQIASTLALQTEGREDERVGQILDQLIELENSSEGQAFVVEKRIRLVMLARSGQSTREAVRAALVRDDSPGKKRTREARERLRTHLDWFDRRGHTLRRVAPAGHALARGIVLHAYGRIQFASGDRTGCIASLSEAVDLLPGYPDVYIDLAKAHLERKGDTNWPQRVTELLDHALALDPANAKAKFVYARFYFSGEARDFAKAESYLRSAPFDPASLFMLAEVLNSRGSHAEALDVLERSIALHKQGPPFRVRLYAESLLELTKVATEPKPDRRALERSRRQLCAYDKLFSDSERTSKNYQRVAETYAEICAALNVAPGTCFQRISFAAAPPPLADHFGGDGATADIT